MVSVSHNRSQRLEWRTHVVFATLLLIWGAIAFRLLYLQWYRRDELVQKSSDQASYLEQIPPRPGDIVDRNGRLLATSVVTKSLYVVPQKILNTWHTSSKLAEVLNISAESLFERISQHRGKQFLWVKRRLDNETAEQIQKLGLTPGTWGFREEFLRRYPNGPLAAHLLGIRDVDGRGRGGIEQSYHALISGIPGHRRLIRDSRGRVIDVHTASDQAPVDGRRIRLSIDSVIQLFAEQAVDRMVADYGVRRASAIVVDPKSGEVLAMVSRPTFDPNAPIDVPAAAWKNNAIGTIIEPGSTFKPFVVAVGLEQGIISKSEFFNCELGEYQMGRRLLHDHHPYGMLDLTDVLVKSSNIGMAKIGERMTNLKLYESTLLFGFGSLTGIELPGEMPGIVHPLEQWDAYSTGSIPMGQELAVTPIQLISAHAALCNNGLLTAPKVVLGAESVDNSTSRSELKADTAVVTPTISGDVARWIVQVPMREVVRRGTGTKGKIEGHSVFGKTGTAQKMDPATGRISDSLHVSSFVCGAPAENPAAVVLVIADEPAYGPNHYGGVIAAPTGARILESTLNRLGISPTSRSFRTVTQGKGTLPR